MKELIVSTLQINLVWENPVQNRINIEEKVNQLNKTHLVVLPEMFTTGFSMTPKALAENMDGETITWLKQLAYKKQIAICGSLIIEEKSNFYNRFMFVEPNGTIYTYDKRHLFTLAGEQHQYTAGNKQTIITYKGWKIKPQVCYDLRFPVWARNTEDYDVLIYVANWPKQRIQAWDTLLQARAIENMCYTIGVNRVGIDPNGNEYNGSSKVIDFMGKEISSIELNKEQITTINLNKEHLLMARKKLNFLNDRDSFTII